MSKYEEYKGKIKENIEKLKPYKQPLINSLLNPIGFAVRKVSGQQTESTDYKYLQNIGGIFRSRLIKSGIDAEDYEKIVSCITKTIAETPRDMNVGDYMMKILSASDSFINTKILDLRKEAEPIITGLNGVDKIASKEYFDATTKEIIDFIEAGKDKESKDLVKEFIKKLKDPAVDKSVMIDLMLVYLDVKDEKAFRDACLKNPVVDSEIEAQITSDYKLSAIGNPRNDMMEEFLGNLKPVKSKKDFLDFVEFNIKYCDVAAMDFKAKFQAIFNIKNDPAGNEIYKAWDAAAGDFTAVIAEIRKDPALLGGDIPLDDKAIPVAGAEYLWISGMQNMNENHHMISMYLNYFNNGGVPIKIEAGKKIANIDYSPAKIDAIKPAMSKMSDISLLERSVKITAQCIKTLNETEFSKVSTRKDKNEKYKNHKDLQVTKLLMKISIGILLFSVACLVLREKTVNLHEFFKNAGKDSGFLVSGVTKFLSMMTSSSGLGITSMNYKYVAIASAAAAGYFMLGEKAQKHKLDRATMLQTQRIAESLEPKMKEL